MSHFFHLALYGTFAFRQRYQNSLPLRTHLCRHMDDCAGVRCLFSRNEEQVVFGGNPPGFGDFLLVQINDVLISHAAEFDPLHAELARRNFTRAAKILRNFVVDDGDSKQRMQRLGPRGSVGRNTSRSNDCHAS